jgi:hypothetical protein
VINRRQCTNPQHFYAIGAAKFVRNYQGLSVATPEGRTAGG